MIELRIDEILVPPHISSDNRMFIQFTESRTRNYIRLQMHLTLLV